MPHNEDKEASVAGAAAQAPSAGAAAQAPSTTDGAEQGTSQPPGQGALPVTGEPERTMPDKPPPESPGLLSDCRLMLSYARKNGFEISADLHYEIAWLDGVLATLNISPISAISTLLLTPLTKEEIARGFRPRVRFQRAPTVQTPVRAPRVEVLPDPGTAEAPDVVLDPHQVLDSESGPVPAPDPEASDASVSAAGGLSPEEMVLKVHAELSALISPTTALSLQTSEPPPGKVHIFGGMPPLVEKTIWVALASALFFTISAAVIGHDASVAAAAEVAAKKASEAALRGAASSSLSPSATVTPPPPAEGASK